MLKVYQENPHHRVIQKTVEVLKKGGIIIYPTDTTYGLGADINNKKAIERILQLKHESKFKALSFICSEFSELTDYVQIDNHAFKLMKRCLPGPFTFVLPAKRLVPKLMLSKQKTAGIRVPDDAFCKQLVQELGHPIVSTSLPSPEGEILNDPHEIFDLYHKRVDLIIEAGFLDSEPSTVVDLTEGDPIILREGKGDVNKLY